MTSSPISLELGRAAAPTVGAARRPYPSVEPVSFAAVTVLVLWLGFLAVGLLGLALPYLRPRPFAQQPTPIQAEILNVELTQDAMAPPSPEPRPPPDPFQPPPLPDLAVLLETPRMMAVAKPNSVIAFALPVEAPSSLIEPKNADYVRADTPAVSTPAPSPKTITFGQGEGKQPAPPYPRQAAREGQEGTVLIRFTVGENGHVFSAEAITPSRWPLLNEAALRAVRERWQFRAGSIRVYDVSIRFELKKHKNL